MLCERSQPARNVRKARDRQGAPWRPERRAVDDWADGGGRSILPVSDPPPTTQTPLHAEALHSRFTPLPQRDSSCGHGQSASHQVHHRSRLPDAAVGRGPYSRAGC